jgi:hypothetical protein
MKPERSMPDDLRARIAKYCNPYRFLELEEPPEEPTLQQKWEYKKSSEDEHPSSQNRRAVTADGSVSREDVEKLLDEVLLLYKPYVARSEWSQVLRFRLELLEELTQSGDLMTKAVRGLEQHRFSLMPGEKVQYNRAPATRIISELKKLLS